MNVEMDNKVVKERKVVVQSSDSSTEDDEEEQLCTKVEQCLTRPVSSMDKRELILEVKTLIEPTEHITEEFQVEETSRCSIGGVEDTETYCDELIEIELISDPEVEEDVRSANTRSAGGEKAEKMYVDEPSFRLTAQEAIDEQELAQQHRQFRQEQHQHGTFGEAPTKIEFASRRMKDYFESFRGNQHCEKRRLYQFFKSTRTELVACLLFSLITSQTLIISRSGSLQLNSGATHNLTYDLIAHHQTTNSVSANLIHAISVAFTVATLTQVFGHVSGCHLLPSISLALYVKGHIGKSRLASYLVAQSAGAGLGISLLSLLQSSQISLDDYWHTLRSAHLRYSSPEAQDSELSKGYGSRRKREATPVAVGVSSGKEGAAAEVDSLSDADGGGSETILLSIMEQQQQSKLVRRSQPPPPASSFSSSSASVSFLPQLPERNINNKSTYPVTEASSLPAQPSTTATFMEQLTTPTEAPTIAMQPTTSSTLVSSTTVNAPTTIIVNSTNRPFETGDSSNDRSRVSVFSSAPGATAEEPNLPVALREEPELNHQRPAARRRNKRNRLTQTTTSSSINSQSFDHLSSASSESMDVMQSTLVVGQEAHPVLIGSKHRQSNNNNNQQPPAAGYYINLLELSLPSAIMSSESIRYCINKQIQMSHQQPFGLVMNESALATLGFRQCLSLSNSSQMFVFQLIATLLTVLAYLVNVDPRRVDLGFKSLSIGIAYFVACLVTVQSGGFYGNPFQLLFLSWLSPGTEWRSEWFVYLVTPLVGGLFGAVSHEYIDFTSPRNRNKQLHLRRSFYSLDNLPSADQPQLQQLPVLLDASPTASAHHKAHCKQLQQQLQSSMQLQQTSNRQQMGLAESSRTRVVGEVSPLRSGGGQLVAAAARRSRRPSSNSSLDSNGTGSSSSVVSLGRGTVQDQMLTTHSDQQELFEKPGNARKLQSKSSLGKNNNCSRSSSYSRRLKTEHQQQLQMADRQGKMNQSPVRQSAASVDFEKRTSLRRSDFDSNFLISSSMAEPGSSPIANPRQHQLVNGSVGWM